MFQRLVLFCAVLCASCSLPAVNNPSEISAGGPVGGKSDRIILYQCDSGRQIMASYPEEGDRAVLSYQGKRLRLTRAIAASGARYVGDDHEWWSKGREASLFQGEAENMLLEACHQDEGTK